MTGERLTEVSCAGWGDDDPILRDNAYGNPFWKGLGAVIVRSGRQREKDRGGFVRQLPEHETYEQPAWWATDMLPEPLRHDSGHEGSHTFLTHEFVDALVEGRQPTVDVNEALACTAPGSSPTSRP